MEFLLRLTISWRACLLCSLAKAHSLRVFPKLMQLLHHVSYFTVGFIQWSFTSFSTIAYIQIQQTKQIQNCPRSQLLFQKVQGGLEYKTYKYWKNWITKLLLIRYWVDFKGSYHLVLWPFFPVFRCPRKVQYLTSDFFLSLDYFCSNFVATASSYIDRVPYFS